LLVPSFRIVTAENTDFRCFSHYLLICTSLNSHCNFRSCFEAAQWFLLCYKGHDPTKNQFFPSTWSAFGPLCFCSVQCKIAEKFDGPPGSIIFRSHNFYFMLLWLLYSWMVLSQKYSFLT